MLFSFYEYIDYEYMSTEYIHVRMYVGVRTLIEVIVRSTTRSGLTD